jgi:acyl-CoA thioesterase YciA
MSNEMPQPAGGAHLRTVALPRDANASGDIFGGWTLSQMDLAGGTFAAALSGKRVVTVRIKPVSVGDDVSVFCELEHKGDTSIAVRIEVWARVRTADAPHKVAEGVFCYVAVDVEGKPAPAN